MVWALCGTRHLPLSAAHREGIGATNNVRNFCPGKLGSLIQCSQSRFGLLGETDHLFDLNEFTKYRSRPVALGTAAHDVKALRPTTVSRFQPTVPRQRQQCCLPLSLFFSPSFSKSRQLPRRRPRYSSNLDMYLGQAGFIDDDTLDQMKGSGP